MNGQCPGCSSYASAVAKAIAKRPQSAAGGTRYGCDIWSGGTDYSAVDSPGGPIILPWTVRGDHGVTVPLNNDILYTHIVSVFTHPPSLSTQDPPPQLQSSASTTERKKLTKRHCLLYLGIVSIRSVFGRITETCDYRSIPPTFMIQCADNCNFLGRYGAVNLLPRSAVSLLRSHSGGLGCPSPSPRVCLSCSTSRTG